MIKNEVLLQQLGTQLISGEMENKSQTEFLLWVIQNPEAIINWTRTMSKYTKQFAYVFGKHNYTSFFWKTLWKLLESELSHFLEH